MNTLPSERAVTGFLRTQAFYLAVLLLVAASVTYNISLMYREDAPVRRGQAIDQKSLILQTAREDERTARRHPELVATRLAVGGMNVLLMIGGTAVLVALGFRLAMRGRVLHSHPARTAPWGLWDLLKVVALFVAGTWVFRLIFTVPPIYSLMTVPGWAAEIFGRVLLIGAIVHVALGERHGQPEDLGLRGQTLRNIGIGLLGFLALQPIFWLIVAFQFRTMEEIPMQDAMQSLLLTQSPWVLGLGLFVAVVLAPISEELLFRGFLQPALERWFGGAGAVLVAGLFFSMAHMDLHVLAPLLLLGLTLSYIFYRTRSLAGPIALHMAFNAVAVSWILALKFPGFSH